MIIVGAHVKTAGGIPKAIDRARDLSVEAIQIFAASPQSWARRPISVADAKLFRQGSLALKLHSVWIHGPYLMNFATSDRVLRERSIKTLIADLVAAEALGAKGVIFHLGSHGGRGFDAVLPEIVSALGSVLKNSPKTTWIVLENSAGAGGGVGAQFEELGEITKQLNNDRVKICLDTQHTFAAGHPIHQADGLAETLQKFDQTVGLERLVAFHANDSRVPFASGLDRHANIGEGEIGEAGFRLLTNHPKLQGLPFLLEVPGDDHDGPNKENVDRLRLIASSR